MNIRNIAIPTLLCLVRNCVKVVFYNLRYGNRFITCGKQFWSRSFFVDILNGGSINVGKCLQTRHGCTLIAHGGHLSIGNNCFFNSNVSITAMDSIRIGDRCAIGPNVVIVDHDHDIRSQWSNEFTTTAVSIGCDTWIGANSVILRGTKIGEKCVIAAGSVIKGSVLDGTMLYQKRESTLKRINKV